MVAVPTRGDRSPDELLDALSRQGADDIVVVCNRARIPPSLAEICTRAGARIVAEPRPGFASVRNRILHEARTTSPRVDALAMIDDDEVPVDGWLRRLLQTRADTGAWAVIGPVRTRWPAGTPRYVVRADLPRRDGNRPRGAPMSSGVTGNCLLWLPELGDVTFRETFDRTGGEDSAFFHDVVAAGGSIVWEPDAVVFEWAPPERMSARGLVRRAYRNGRSFAGATGTSAPRALLGNRRRAPKAVLLLLAGIVRGRGDLLLRAAWETSFVCGIIASALHPKPEA